MCVLSEKAILPEQKSLCWQLLFNLIFTMWAVDLQVRINGSYMATGRLWFSILVHKPKRLTASIMNLVSWQRNLT